MEEGNCLEAAEVMEKAQKEKTEDYEKYERKWGKTWQSTCGY